MSSLLKYGRTVLLIAITSYALSIPLSPGVLLPASSQSQSIVPQINISSTSLSPLQTVYISSLLSTTNFTGVELRCDDARFGHPSITSCRQALDKIPPDILSDPTYSFGPRANRRWDIGLPRRYIGCAYDLSP